MDIWNHLCLPHMLEQGEQKLGSSLHPQFAYLESTDFKQKCQAYILKESSIKELGQNVEAMRLS